MGGYIGIMEKKGILYGAKFWDPNVFSAYPLA